MNISKMISFYGNLKNFLALSGIDHCLVNMIGKHFMCFRVPTESNMAFNFIYSNSTNLKLSVIYFYFITHCFLGGFHSLSVTLISKLNIYHIFLIAFQLSTQESFGFF